MRLTIATFILISPLSVYLISPLSVYAHSDNLNHHDSFPVDNPAQRHLHSQMQQQQQREQLKLHQDMQKTRQRQAQKRPSTKKMDQLLAQ